MQWLSFFEQQPEHGQDIWYYGQYIGVWVGRYSYCANDPFSPHRIFCYEAPGVVDRMDAPWWMPDDGIMSRPTKPNEPYPKDYPNP